MIARVHADATVAIYRERGASEYSPRMERNDVVQVMQDLERSIQLRQALLGRLARNEEVDLAQEWETIEQLEMELSRKIRKRPLG